MRKIISIALCAGLITTASFARGGYDGGYVSEVQQVTTEATSSLSQEHIDNLLFMYEEEKMARDVYRTLGDTWNAKIFYNIQQAEQKHMDAIASLLVAYGIAVPSLEDTTGIFENEEIQDLYDQLVDVGQNSLTDAYKVGVMVEETDIADLEEKIADVPSDIEKVYNSLLSGSYNHLNAFNRVLGN